MLLYISNVIFKQSSKEPPATFLKSISRDWKKNREGFQVKFPLIYWELLSCQTEVFPLLKKWYV